MPEYTFNIFRFDPEKGEKPYFEGFKVDIDRNNFTVLDGLYYIQDRLDGSLAFRSSCRAAVCGSCAMHINGRYRLACNTLVSTLKSAAVTIRPLAHLEIYQDLFVNMEPFWEKYELIKPYLIPGSPSPEGGSIQSPDERARLGIMIDCILCACCYSSCTVTSTSKGYLGPASLLKANRFVCDSRDGAAEERLAIVNTEDGVWRCHTIFNCQEVCPKEISPAEAIAGLKMRLIKRKLFG